MAKRKTKPAHTLHSFYCEVTGFKRYYHLNVNEGATRRRDGIFDELDVAELQATVRKCGAITGKLLRDFRKVDLRLYDSERTLSEWGHGFKSEEITAIGCVIGARLGTIACAVTLPRGVIDRLVPLFAVGAIKEFCFFVKDLKRGNGLITSFSVSTELTDEEDM